jgi:hypothetical protein
MAATLTRIHMKCMRFPPIVTQPVDATHQPEQNE